MEDNRKVLVTGANGLLGSHVVRELSRRNYKVRIFIREKCNMKALEGTETERFEGRIELEKDVDKAVRGCNYVIHVAARTSQVPSDLAAYYKPNVESTRILMEAGIRHRIRKFVFVSTANCFGNGTKENPGNESMVFLPWLKKSGYAYSKYLAQQMVLKEANKNRINATIVNPAFIIGENDVKPSSGQIFSIFLNRKIVFYTPGGKNFIGAESAAEGVILAMEKGEKGTCYLLTGENLSYREFGKMVSQITGEKQIRICLPAWLILTAGWLGDKWTGIFKKPVMLDSVNAKLVCLKNYYSSARARQEIGFYHTPVRDSVEKAIKWFRAEGYFK